MANKIKTIIITGANSGLGYECAHYLGITFKDYRIILACRNTKKAEIAKTELIKLTNSQNIISMELDVSSMSSVRNFITNYKNLKDSELIGLVCNAGIMGRTIGITSEGFDIVFATNHLGHFLLTNLLLPLMHEHGRIIVVSSDMHCPPGGTITWPNVESLAHPSEYLANMRTRYPFSKLCNIYFTYELSKRLKEVGSTISVNAFNPGLMTETNFAPNKSRYTPEFLKSVADRIGSLDLSSQAITTILTDPRFEGMSGKYFDRSTSIIDSSPLSYNKDNALELWNKSIEYTSLNNENNDLLF